MGLYAVVFGVLVVLALAMPPGTSRRNARQRAKIAKRNAELAQAMETHTTDTFTPPSS